VEGRSWEELEAIVYQNQAEKAGAA